MKDRGSLKKMNQEKLVFIAVKVLPEETCDKTQFTCTEYISTSTI